ncbi:unnamed protein product [Anisakis simplex]|uniref:Uncharacterized protein n=1 Tax=Anisakis simplex TaxID=6269 RepID=A0A0M3JJE3_ANISI|nr:unnamed protein product [Anisakis simplex]
MTIRGKIVIYFILLSFVTSACFAILTSPFFTMRKGPRNPFRILDSIVDARPTSSELSEPIDGTDHPIDTYPKRKI